MAFSADGVLIASIAGERFGDRPDEVEVLIWEQTGTVRHQLIGHHHRPVAVAFPFPAATALPRPAGTKQIKLWDVASGEEMLTLQGHTDVVTSLVFAPDGTWLASASLDGTVRRFWHAGK